MKTLNQALVAWRYRLAPRLASFTVGVCAAALFPTLLRADTQNVSPTSLSDNALRSCGPLALKMVMSRLSHSVDLAQCAALAGTDPNGVTTLAGLRRAAKAMDCSVIGMRLTPQELAMIDRPGILHASLPAAKDHFLVFASSRGHLFRLLDPVRGEQENLYTADQLQLMWPGNCLVFTPHPFLLSLRVGAFRARGLIVALIGIGLGILAGILAPRRLSRHRASSFGKMPPSTCRSIIAALAIASVLSAGMVLLGLLMVHNIRSKGKGPRLILGATVLDAGDLAWGTPFTTSMWVGNRGAGTLTIDKKGVTSSCSCVRVGISRPLLEEDDNGELRIRIAPPKRIGPFEYSVYVPSNDSLGGKVLRIKGQVTGPGGVVYPPQLYFGRLDSTEGAHKILSYIFRRPGVRVLKVICNSPSVVASFQRGRLGCQIDVSLVELPAHGPFNTTLEIVTSDPEQPQITVPVYGFVTP